MKYSDEDEDGDGEVYEATERQKGVYTQNRVFLCGHFYTWKSYTNKIMNLIISKIKQFILNEYKRIKKNIVWDINLVCSQQDYYYYFFRRKSQSIVLEIKKEREERK